MTQKITVANVQHFSMVGKNVAAVVAATHKIETAKDYADKVRTIFGGKLEIVPNSIRNASQSEHAKAVAFHVRPVCESRPFEAAEQMRTVVEANVFADENDATWNVVEAGGVKRLVKITETDISGLLSAAQKQSYNRIAASFYDGNVGDVHNEEFAIFVNPKTAQVDTGIMFYNEHGAMQALSRSSGELVEIAHEAIVAHSNFDVEADPTNPASVETAAEFKKRDASGLIAYYRKLFASQPGFFNALETQIRKRFLLA